MRLIPLLGRAIVGEDAELAAVRAAVLRAGVRVRGALLRAPPLRRADVFVAIEDRRGRGAAGTRRDACGARRMIGAL